MPVSFVGGAIVPISATPANAVVQRDGTIVVQRDSQIVVNQRP
jgi:hypothetical protein